VDTPASSFLSGGANGAVRQADVTGTLRLEGLAPKGGGNYRLDFSSIRSTTSNQFAALNPQYPTALTFNFTQPLLRGLRTDNSRRQIEIAKKNLSLTDAQFRQRAIETITNVQRSYWDLVFALRNLQIQRDAVRDARTQLEHNKRMVTEGQLAPIEGWVSSDYGQREPAAAIVYAASTRLPVRIVTLIVPVKDAAAGAPRVSFVQTVPGSCELLIDGAEHVSVTDTTISLSPVDQ